jgi:F-type H+-transporting ATPase subunit delta
MPETIDQEFHETADVGTQRVARVYAEALLTAAARRRQAQDVLDELQALVGEVFKANPQFEAFLAGGAVGRNRKTEVIDRIFKDRASELFVNFLNVLNDHERLGLLRPILNAYRELHDQQAGRIQVQVRSAVGLPDDQRQGLVNALRQGFRAEPVLESKIDPELLGGLVVQVGDWMYDASVRTQLDNLRNQLIERSSHEIQSRRDRFSSAIGN